MNERPDLPTALTRRSVLSGAAALGALLVSGCGASTGATTSAADDAISLTDQRGKKLELSRPATRIVTIPMPAASMLIAIDGRSDHVVGMNNASWEAMNDGLLGAMFPQGLTIDHDVAGSDFQPNVESILALKPDVVVQWADHGADIVAPLENAGLTVLGLSYGTEDDLTTWIKLFAGMLGKPQRATDILTRFDAAEKDIKAAAAHRPEPAVKVLYFLQFGDLKVAGAGTYNDWYIAMVGADNPAAAVGTKATQGFVSVNIEQILDWDPDVVLLGKSDKSMPADVYGDKVWRDVSAVRTRRVYRVPLGGYPWDAPNQESPLMWRWLSDVVFPPKASDLRATMADYYKFLYGYTVSDADIDQILVMKANGDSADYGQFSGH